MDVFAKTIAILLVSASFLFFACIVSPLIGAFSGWVVGLFFEDTIRLVLSAFGVPATFEIWQLGATLGFIGVFFKTIARTEK